MDKTVTELERYSTALNQQALLTAVITSKDIKIYYVYIDSLLTSHWPLVTSSLVLLLVLLKFWIVWLQEKNWNLRMSVDYTQVLNKNIQITKTVIHELQ